MRGRAVARGRPIVVEWAAEVRDFLRGTRQVEKSVDEVADELQDAAKDADRFEDRFTEAMRDAERQADRSARNMGRDFGRLEGDMADVGKEGASELKQNLSEGLSSGNIEDVVQDTLGGLVSGLSGVLGGVVAGLAGIGAIAFQQMREDAELQMQALVSIGEAVVTRMQEIQSSILTARDAQIVLNEAVAENPEYWLRIKELADEAGVDWFEFASAVIEGGAEAQDAYEKLNDIITDNVAAESRSQGVRALNDQGEAAEDLREELQDVEGKVQDLAKEYEITADAAGRLLDISDRTKRNLQGARDATRGLRGELPYGGGNVPV